MPETQEKEPKLRFVQIPIARGGINKNIEPTSLEGVFTPQMVNMIIEPRRVRKRLGYSELGLNLPLDGIGSQLIDYIDARGNLHTIAITTTHAYEYQPSLDNWIQITPSTFIDGCESGWTAGSGDTVAHDTSDKIREAASCKITLVAERSDGNLLAYKDIDLVDVHLRTHIGFWIKSTIALAANALEIVVSESNHAAGEKTGTYVECLSTALEADVWKFVCLEKTLTDFNAVISCSIFANATLASGLIIRLDDVRGYTPLAGDATKRVGFTIATDLDQFTLNGGAALIITNGVDDLFQYEGHQNDVLTTLAHGYADFANCAEVAEFWNHFMMINFNTGSNNVRSFAYASAGDIDEYVLGTSGLVYLTDSRGSLARAAKIGADLVLYSDRSITACRYYGETILFLCPTLIHRAGLYVDNGLIELTNKHQLIGTDQRIYEFSGGTELKSIGSNIEASFFGELDSSKKARIVTGYDEANDRSYFAFPRAHDDYSKASYCLNQRQPESPWEYFEFSDDVRAFCMYESTIELYCDDNDFSGVYCDEMALYCDAPSSSSGFSVLITLTSDGYVFKHDEAFGKDGDADIECEYQTQDITTGEKEYFGRWEWLAFEARSILAGGEVSVYYSINGGVSWVEFDDSPISLEYDWTVHRIPLDVVSREIRFRFYQNSSADLQIRDDMFASFVLETARS